MTKFVGITSKTYPYLIDDGSIDKQAKGTKKVVIKQRIKFEDYKNDSHETTLMSSEKFKNDEKK